jgi:hypothetical protein
VLRDTDSVFSYQIELPFIVEASPGITVAKNIPCLVGRLACCQIVGSLAR